MPSGPPELHEKWVSDSNACRYLEERGYKLRPDWLWALPEGQATPTPEENEAICYLIWEWDYGGLE